MPTQPGSPAFRRVPPYAWAWLHRSRPVLVAAAERLTGGAPTAAFVEELRERFEDDEFTRTVLVDVIAEVAFNGRVPSRRPAGVSWDRGLTWWAAALAGTTPQDFEARGEESARQHRLFDVPAQSQQPARRAPRAGAARAGPSNGRPASAERAVLAGMLRDLLAGAVGGQIPASAVQQLLAQLENSASDA